MSGRSVHRIDFVWLLLIVLVRGDAALSKYLFFRGRK